MTTDWAAEAKGTGEYADVNGINLYYETHGAGRPMILLHGGLGSGEVSRLIALGASEVHWDKRPPDADYVILADPEGNRFCVIDAS